MLTENKGAWYTWFACTQFKIHCSTQPCKTKSSTKRLGCSHQLALSPCRPLPDFLSQSHGENSVLHSCRIKSGNGLGTKLATNYAPDEVMRTLSHCLETILHTIRKLIGVRLLCRMRGETDLDLHILLPVRKSSCRT